MTEWFSPAIEFLLLGLKVIGLIGAFIGLSGESASKSRKRRKLAFAFLAMAIGAELCDSMLKRLDAREQAVRFERLAHPMGTIRVTTLYRLSLEGDAFRAYRSRIELAETVLPPNRKTEPQAFALLNAIPEIWAFLYRSQDGQKPRTDREPDLSFEVASGRVLGGRNTSELANPRTIGGRDYSYGAGDIHVQTAAIANSPEDRYSNGSIISTEDLLGALLEVRFCALTGAALDGNVRSDLERRVIPETIYVSFPGRQEFGIAPNQAGVSWTPPSAADRCSYLEYRFPSNREEFKKAMVP